MNNKFSNNFFTSALEIGAIMLIIYLTSFYSYTLFHSLTEIMSIIIGLGIYMIAWNTRDFNSNKYFTFLGIAYFFISIFEVFHTLAYQGLGIFTNYPGSNLATQLWLITRYLEAFSFLVATYFIGKKLNISRTFYFYCSVSLALFASVFWLPIFPVAYINGQGLTSFKEISEIIICVLYLCAIFSLSKKRESFNPKVFKLLIWALSLSIISEITFMIYVGVYDSLNLIGHLLKICVFSLFYIAFIDTGLRKPYAILFKDLKDSEIKYRQSEEKFRTIFNNATISIVMTNLTGDIIEANQRFANKIGYFEAELLSLAMTDLSSQDIDILDNKEFRKIINGEIDSYEFENLYIKKNREILWGATGISLLKDTTGSPAYLLWLIKDITQTKEMEKTKLEFVSLASHQLRTPLTSVRLATELLLRGVGGETDEKQKRYLNEINDSAKLMSDMIKDLLNVSRVEMGTLTIKFEPLDLTKHFDQIIEELTLQIKAKNLELNKSYEPNLPVIFFDHQILRMIFENILTNAICYTPAGGKIGIKVTKTNGKILLAISDTGCGIPESSRDRIFEKTFRTNTAKEINPNGNGIGLYIVKAVAEKAGGKVWFDSKEGEGTTFFVSLPIKQ